MTDEFSDDDMVEDDDRPEFNDAEDPAPSSDDNGYGADDPASDYKGDSEDVSTDASVQERAEAAKEKMRKGRKAKDVRSEPTKPVLSQVKAAKKAAPTPSVPKKASPAKKAPSPAKASPKKAAAKSPARDRPSSKDRILAMRGAAILLRQVGDPTRAAVIDLLCDGPRNVTDICKALGGMSQPAVSHHLALLRHGRIISPTREGKNNFYALEKIGVELAGIIRTLSASA